jgi:hypothetical protein
MEVSMRSRKTYAYIALAVVLLTAAHVGLSLAPPARADHHESSRAAVKIVYAIDYPLGEKASYLEWIQSIAPQLQEPEELRSLASYDNYHGASPHRFVEFEFDSMEDVTAYFANENIRAVLDDLPNHASNIGVHTMTLRGDYTR